MADNNNVTIDAAWFAELYAAAKNGEKDCEKCRLSLSAFEFQKIIKERDELKAKLEEREKSLSQATLGEFNRLRESLAAAERCIDDIDKTMSRKHTEMRVDWSKIGDIILAYRENKEAAR